LQANIKHSQTRMEDFSRRAEKLEEYANTTKYDTLKHLCTNKN